MDNTDYPIDWNPYEWHKHHKEGKPDWRVKQDMFETRDRLCKEFSVINDRMGNGENSFSLVDKWYELHIAILACEEFRPNAG